MQYEYCPDPEDSDLVFNIPAGVLICSVHNSFIPLMKLVCQLLDTTTFQFTGDDAKNLAVEENYFASDSDEAPDDVSFSKSKVAALSVLKAEEQFKRITKEEQKKRRQKKEALMKEQKAKTLQSLASKRLPDNSHAEEKACDCDNQNEDENSSPDDCQKKEGNIQ